MPYPANSLERVLEQLDRSGDCWLPTSRLNSDGYAVVSVAGHQHRLHRFVYELLVGPIPEGMHLDHLCRVRHCANSAHLEPVTCKINLDRSPFSANSQNQAKTYCDSGHPFDEANTYIRKDGTRACRTCVRLATRRWREKQRAHS